MIMKYSVINGETSIGKIYVTDVAGASTFIVGDVKTIRLASVFETPAEALIVGVTLSPFTPAPREGESGA